MSDLYWMQQAVEIARIAKEQGEVPVGAVLVDENDQLLASAGNQVVTTNDPTAHAEIITLRNAAHKVENYRLENSTLYVTLEPCSMCAGALVHARIKRVVFGARDFKAGAAGSVVNLLKGYPFNHQVLIDEGVLQHECSQLLSSFFKDRR